jgi:hypothetical protein
VNRQLGPATANNTGETNIWYTRTAPISSLLIPVMSRLLTERASLAEQPAQRLAAFRVGQFSGRGFCHNDHPHSFAERGTFVAIDLADVSLDPVSGDGVSHFSGDGHSHFPPLPLGHIADEGLTRCPAPMFEYPAKFAGRREALAAWKGFPARHERFTTLQLVGAALAALQPGLNFANVENDLVTAPHFVGHGEALAALVAPALEHLTAVGRFHPRQEPVGPSAAQV